MYESSLAILTTLSILIEVQVMFLEMVPINMSYSACERDLSKSLSILDLTGFVTSLLHMLVPLVTLMCFYQLASRVI